MLSKHKWEYVGGVEFRHFCLSGRPMVGQKRMFPHIGPGFSEKLIEIY